MLIIQKKFASKISITLLKLLKYIMFAHYRVHKTSLTLKIVPNYGVYLYE